MVWRHIPPSDASRISIFGNVRNLKSPGACTRVRRLYVTWILLPLLLPINKTCAQYVGLEPPSARYIVVRYKGELSKGHEVYQCFDSTSSYNRVCDQKCIWKTCSWGWQGSLRLKWSDARKYFWSWYDLIRCLCTCTLHLWAVIVCCPCVLPLCVALLCCPCVLPLCVAIVFYPCVLPVRCPDGCMVLVAFRVCRIFWTRFPVFPETRGENPGSAYKSPVGHGKTGKRAKSFFSSKRQKNP